MPSDLPNALVESCAAKLDELMNSDPYIRSNYLAYMNVRETWFSFQSMMIAGHPIDGGYYANMHLPKMQAALSMLGQCEHHYPPADQNDQGRGEHHRHPDLQRRRPDRQHERPGAQQRQRELYVQCDGCLTSITYPNAEVSTFTYDANGHMLTARKPDGYNGRLRLTASRVKSVTE